LSLQFAAEVLNALRRSGIKARQQVLDVTHASKSLFSLFSHMCANEESGSEKRIVCFRRAPKPRSGPTPTRCEIDQE
jgi:hypothetical protein